MVATQEQSVWPPLLDVHQQLDNAIRIRTAVDIVANKDQAVILSELTLQPGEHAPQQADLPVNVSNCIEHAYKDAATRGDVKSAYRSAEGCFTYRPPLIIPPLIPPLIMLPVLRCIWPWPIMPAL